MGITKSCFKCSFLSLIDLSTEYCVKTLNSCVNACVLAFFLILMNATVVNETKLD